MGPFVFDKSGGQRVEELGMGGRDAHGAEVVDGGHDAPAEEVVPNPVGGDAGGEWVCSGDDLFSQFEPAGGLARWRDFFAAEGGEETTGNFLAEVFVGTTDVDVVVFGRAVRDRKNGGSRVGDGL